MARYASIWFPRLLTDHLARKQAVFRDKAFVMSAPERGRMVVVCTSARALGMGISNGMVVADCKAIFPDLDVVEAESGQAQKLIKSLAEWFIRYTPFVSVDGSDGLILDTSGCTHLWGGEEKYLSHIRQRLMQNGYETRTAIADTIGAAWGVARFGSEKAVAPETLRQELGHLPAQALRLEETVVTKLKKLGLDTISLFMDMPPSVLRRRFGTGLPQRLHQALGREPEIVQPVVPVEPYQQRLCCLDPIRTPEGIAMALRQLLENLCARLEQEGLGIRQAHFRAYRIDGDLQQIAIGTGQSSRKPDHLFKLFEHKIGSFQPDLGFELFVLEAPHVEEVVLKQNALWNTSAENGLKITELLDGLAAKMNPGCIKRYVPVEQHWPERSVRESVSLSEKPAVAWPCYLPRPVHLLFRPEVIEVMVRLPDYPPIQFSYKGKFYNVAKADGPERIEQEWWTQSGKFRDYYCVEDQQGARFWLFRLGPYNERPKWFIHGFFA